jgi:biotin transport system ATP-binding protein
MSLTTSLPPAGARGIKLEAVTLRRGDRIVLEQIDLHLTQSRIGLIGDNGAGKSSLFRLICGLDQPQAGRVAVHGCDTADAAQRRTLPQQVGMMFQNPEDQIIFPTVAEELAFSLTAAGIGKAQARQQAQAFLTQRGWADWGPRAIGELSQGQRQQVCLMALQITSPATLLLDEPYSALDLPSQLRLSAQITATDQQIILSTHLLDHVCDFERVLWLDSGKLRGDGPGRDICAAYAQDVRKRSAAAVAAKLLERIHHLTISPHVALGNDA